MKKGTPQEQVVEGRWQSPYHQVIGGLASPIPLRTPFLYCVLEGWRFYSQGERANCSGGNGGATNHSKAPV
jgi:hypothetical protein